MWSWPDIDGGANQAARSGSGSTVSTTGTVRRFLEETVRNFELGGVVDVPCGDLNWMVHVDGFHELQYFGGDVSSVVIEDHQEAFKDAENTNFGLVDIVASDLYSQNSAIRGIFDRRDVNGVVVVVRQLMQHLSRVECLQVLLNFKELASKTQTPVYVMLTTYLRGNGNEDEEYLLATGHKINLFKYPFCVKDPISMVYDGVPDMFLGLWKVEEEGILGAFDATRTCL